MALCAAIGLALLIWNAGALPRPGAHARAQAAPQPAVTTAPPQSDPARTQPSPATTSTAPAGSGAPTPSTSTTTTFVPESGSGSYEMAKVSVPTTADSGRLYRYDLRVEKDLDLDPDTIGRAIEKTLDDPRSWRYTGRVRFSLVKAGETADVHAYLVTPKTTDKLCAPLLTQGEVSCNAGNKVVLNAKRWTFSSDAFGPDVALYRQYVVNHEFGHALGKGHVLCGEKGKPSPVMQQQTKFLKGCTANAWPSISHG